MGRVRSNKKEFAVEEPSESLVNHSIEDLEAMVNRGVNIPASAVELEQRARSGNRDATEALRRLAKSGKAVAFIALRMCTDIKT